MAKIGVFTTPGVTHPENREISVPDAHPQHQFPDPRCMGWVKIATLFLLSGVPCISGDFARTEKWPSNRAPSGGCQKGQNRVILGGGRGTKFSGFDTQNR